MSARGHRKGSQGGCVPEVTPTSQLQPEPGFLPSVQEFDDELQLLDQPELTDVGWRLARPYRPNDRLPQCRDCPAALICEAGGSDIVLICEQVLDDEYEFTDRVYQEEPMPSPRVVSEELEQELWERYAAKNGERGVIKALWEEYSQEHPDLSYSNVAAAIKRKRRENPGVVQVRRRASDGGPAGAVTRRLKHERKQREADREPDPEPEQSTKIATREESTDVATVAGAAALPSLTGELEDLVADLQAVEQRATRVLEKVAVVKELIEAVL